MDQDVDGDGVGNACDPSADKANQILFFTGFNNQPSGATLYGGASISGGALFAPAGGSFFLDQGFAGASRVYTGGSVGEAAADVRIAAVGDSSNPLLFCGLRDVVSPPAAEAFIHRNGVDYAATGRGAGMLTNDAFVLAMNTSGSCQATHAATYTLSAPGQTAVGGWGLGTSGMSASFYWMIVISE